ncbi:MAG: hypothetical protein IT294_08365 [Deltaproteobacteria bacterium]|nr:hypothetical protein [Deltaproteobacteria bacterium]
MRMRVWRTALLLGAAAMLAGCGGDNLHFCDGCSTPTPRQTATPTPTPTTTPSDDAGS